jgi:Ca-activated chloride channel family protein
VPDLPVFDRLAEVWHETKKHAVIALVVDRSSTVDRDKLQSAKLGLTRFIESMDPQDYVVWMPFGETVQPVIRGRIYDVGDTLKETIQNEEGSRGGSALYEAINQAYSDLESQRQLLGDTVRYGIVVLTDGRDTRSKVSFTQLRTRLDAGAGDPTRIQIHTIGISDEARKDSLSIIATTAHGRYWDASDPRRLASIYEQIAVYY